MLNFFRKAVIAVALLAVGVAQGGGIVSMSGSRQYGTTTAIVDGGHARITGSGWGTNAAVVRSLKPEMESASSTTAFSSFSGFANTGGETGTHITQITTSTPFYGTKCFISNNDGSSTGGLFGVAYDTGGVVTNLFTRDYVRITATTAVTDGQWKMIRWNGDGDVTDGAPANMYMANWFVNGFDFILVNSTGDQRDGFDWNTAYDVWYERETYIAPGTQGGANGRIEVRFRRTSDYTEVSNVVYTNMQNYNSANRIRQLVYQNYQGNNVNPPGNWASAVRMDALYISNGSQQRIYLANASTWAAVSQREIQTYYSWADGQIDFTVSKGWLSSLSTVWAYVVDASGTVVNSSGYTVTGIP